MKKFILFILLSVSLCVLAGCADSPSTDDGKTNLIIGKDKVVTQRIREDFSENYYDAGELKNMILDEAASYNNKHVSGAVSVNKVNVSENNITNVEMVYMTANDYADFNGEMLFVGTGEEAVKEGCSLKQILTNTENSAETIAEAELKEMTNDTILIYGGEYAVFLPGKIKYASDNAFLSEDKKAVRLKEGQNGPFYIVY